MLAWQRLHLATALFNVRIGGESPIFAAVPEDTLLAAIAMSIMTNAESVQRTFQRFEEETRRLIVARFIKHRAVGTQRRYRDHGT